MGLEVVDDEEVEAEVEKIEEDEEVARIYEQEQEPMDVGAIQKPIIEKPIHISLGENSRIQVW